MRKSKTKGKRQKTQGARKKQNGTQRKAGFEEKHPYERQREKEKKRTQGLLFVRSALPPIDYCY